MNHDRVSAEGGPAFPVNIPGYGDNGWHGMTLRDWFAGQALAGPLLVSTYPGMTAAREPMSEWCVREAYAIADMMLSRRSKEPT